MKIACIGYRSWALKIYEKLQKSTKHQFLMQNSKEQFNCESIILFSPDLILFYGWSWTVPDELVQNYKCLMLHPSPLPFYRGGSPIQNQIINNETSSKVTIFIMNERLDSGPIVGQANLNLQNSIENIFKQITAQGIKLTLDILKYGLKPIKQDETKATYFKRRKPHESEITLEELKNKDGAYLMNKIRMLDDPYPNAFLQTSDGYKLVIKSAYLVKIE
jgi:methionyl-tRNA formyltransferase